jgi:anti-anti-sigma regulatory factor
MHAAMIPIKNGSQFTAEESGNTVIIHLKPKSLDARLSERDRLQVTDLLVKYRQVVVDFAEIGTTNGTGLEMIADWIKFVQSAGNALVLAQCSRHIHSLLGILRISRVVPVVASLREALAYFEVGQKTVSHHA